jgi:hypothetical protein
MSIVGEHAIASHEKPFFRDNVQKQGVLERTVTSTFLAFFNNLTTRTPKFAPSPYLKASSN